MSSPVILIIEDDDFQYEIYEEALSQYKLTRVKNGTDARCQERILWVFANSREARRVERAPRAFVWVES